MNENVDGMMIRLVGLALAVLMMAGMTIYTDTALKEYLEKAGFCQIQSHKNKKGWLCPLIINRVS